MGFDLQAFPIAFLFGQRCQQTTPGLCRQVSQPVDKMIFSQIETACKIFVSLHLRRKNLVGGTNVEEVDLLSMNCTSSSSEINFALNVKTSWEVSDKDAAARSLASVYGPAAACVKKRSAVLVSGDFNLRNSLSSRNCAIDSFQSTVNCNLYVFRIGQICLGTQTLHAKFGTVHKMFIAS